MQDVQSNEQVSPTPGGNGQGNDPLAKLYRMSTTAGVGTQEYVAINPTAVVALLLGFSSILVLLSNVLMVIPVAGIVCGIVALIQIQRSFNTQTGRGLAIFGLLLCVLVTAGRLGYQHIEHQRLVADEEQIGKVMHEFGQDIGSDQYDKAYQLFSDRFRARVSEAEFDNMFRGLHLAGPLGNIRSVEWNHEDMNFEEQPGSDDVFATAMAFYQFEHDQPRRVVMGFEKTGGAWHINEIEAIFPEKKKAAQ